MTFIAGAYAATYNGQDLGVVEDGFTMSYQSRHERIVTDNTGDALNDSVYRGVELRVSFILSEWDLAGVQSAFWPFDSTLGELGDLGRLGSALAQELILTSCGAATTPTSITFYKALLAPDFNVEHLFANSHRKVPMEMIVFPQKVSASSTSGQCDELRLFVTA